MTPLSHTTVVLLESAWTPRFAIRNYHLPETSILSYLQGYATNSGWRLIHRQLRTASDLECWCQAIWGAQLGTRVVVIGGHGDPQDPDEQVIDLSLPDDVGVKDSNRITPAFMKQQLSRCGLINGVVVVACGWGLNPAATWLPDTNSVTWGLTFAEDVDLLLATFFGLKVFDWILDDPAGPPRCGEEAFSRFRSGVKTGREIVLRVDMTGLAKGLQARFCWRSEGRWHTWKPEP